MKTSVSVAAIDVSLYEASSAAFTFLAPPDKFQFRSRDNNTGGTRLILFSTEGSEFGPGVHCLGKFEGKTPAIRSIMLSDKYATELPVRIGSTLTAYGELSTDDVQLHQLPGKLELNIPEDAVPAILQLINMQGIVVQQQTISSPTNITMKLESELPAGIYLLQLCNSRNTSKRWHFKVLITK